jgi:hypothetical protein
MFDKFLFWRKKKKQSLSASSAPERGRRNSSSLRRTLETRLRIEPLEERRMLAAVSWVGGATGLWDKAANWSNNAVPASSDDVTINSATVTIQSGDSESVKSLTTDGNSTLSITGGSLIVAANSTLGGGLTMSGGALTANGTGATLLVNGTTTVSGASLYAEGGATLSLPNLTTYAETDNTTFEATGANSQLNLSGLTSLGSMTNYWHAYALAGGTVNLSGLATINEPNAPLQFNVNGNGSQLNLSALTSFTANPGSSYLYVTGSGSLETNDLVSITGQNITLDGSGTSGASQWQSLTNGSLTLTGGSCMPSALDNVNGSSLEAEGGATLSLPDLTTYTETDNTTFEATGANSQLNLSGLTSLGSMTNYWHTYALAGGTVNLSGLATINEPNASLQFNVNGNGSQLNLSALTSFTANPGSSYLYVTGTGSLETNDLVSITGQNVTLDGSGTSGASQWQSLTNGSLTLTGGSCTPSALTNVNGSSLEAEGGATLSLPYLTTYTETDNTTFEATGANSQLNLSALSTLGSMSSYWHPYALAGGTLNLSGLTTISEPNAGVQIDADGGNSQLNLSSLASFTGNTSSSFQVTHSAAVLDGNLTAFSGVQITLDGSGTIATSPWSSLTNSSLTVTGGSSTLNNLANINGSGLYVQSGGGLSLPAVTSLTAANGTTYLEATGAGSTLTLPALATITATNNTLNIEATSGGQALLLGVVTLVGSDVYFTSTGAGSTINLASLFNYTVLNASATNGGQILYTTGSPVFQWVGSGDGTSWNNPANWSSDQVPGPLDDVVIDLSGNPTIVFNAADGNSTIHALACYDTLSITGGSLTVTAGSQIVGSLSMTGGALTASGAGVTLTASGSTTVSDASLYAEAGAILNLETMAIYSALTANSATYLEASGAGSELNLSSVTTLTGGKGQGGTNWATNIEALAGGQVNLSGWATDSGGAAEVQASGQNSVVNMSQLPEFLSNVSNYPSGLQQSNGGNVLITDLGTLNNVAVSLDGTGTNTSTGQISSLTASTLTVSGGNESFSSLTSLTGSTLTVTGGSPSFTNVNYLNSSSVFVSNGATVSMPLVQGYSALTANSATYLEASGAGSELNLSSVTTLTGGKGQGGTNWATNIEALAGGQVNLSGWTTDGGGAVEVDASGQNSVVNMSQLTELLSNVSNYASGLQAGNGGNVLITDLGTLNNVAVSLDGTGTNTSTGQISSLTASTLTVSGGNESFSSLTSLTASTLTVTGGSSSFTNVNYLNSSSVFVSNGATVSMPLVQSYSALAANSATYLEASGAGSQLNLSSVTTLTGGKGQGGTNWAANIEALGGATVDLSGWTTDGGGAVEVEASGQNSQVKMSTLPEFLSSVTNYSSGLEAINDGSVVMPDLNALNNVVVALDGTATNTSTAQITSLTDSSLTVTGGSPSFAALNDLDNSNVLVSNGAQVSMPALTSYTHNNAANAVTLEATGTGSTLTLANLAGLTLGTSFLTEVNIEALAGGNVILPGLAQINTGPVQLISDGASSVLNVWNVTAFSLASGSWTGSAMQATNNGKILAYSLQSTSGVTTTVNTGGQLVTTPIYDVAASNASISPATPQSGQIVTVNWTDSNPGPTTPNGWNDSVVVTNAAGSTVFSGTQAAAPLAYGGSENQSLQFTLPRGLAGTGNFTVTVTADANNGVVDFNPANNVATTSFNSTLATADETNLTISPLTSTSGPAYTGDTVSLSYTVANSGYVAPEAGWVDDIYLVRTDVSQPNQLLQQIPQGSTTSLPYTENLSFALPSTPGVYEFEVVVDATNSLPQSNETNNTATTSGITVSRLYHAQITAATATSNDLNGQIVAQGTPVTVSGMAYYADSLTPAAGVVVSVRELVPGQTNVFLATTDANGNFSFTYNLSVAGTTVLAADHVDVPADAAPNTPQVAFTVAGIGVTTIGGVQSVTPGGAPLSGQLILTNESPAVLTGLTFTPQGLAPNIQFQFTNPLPTSLGANPVTVYYTISASDASYTYDHIDLHITSDQGASADVAVNVSVTSALPQLSASPGYLSGNMIVGQQSRVSFTVTNYGLGPTGAMTVQLPTSSQAPFLSVVGGTSVASLAPGASTTITLTLNPASTLALTDWNGNLVVGNANVSLSEGYSFRATSTAVGQVQVTVSDDLTLYSAAHPNLAGATVELLDALNTSTVIASAISNANGMAAFSGIPAGNYVVEVSAGNHESAEQSIAVAGSQTTSVNVFAPLNLVSYSWVVTPTAIQDQYTISLQSTFDTQVPVGINFSAGGIPSLLPGQTGELDLTLHNISLIALKNVEIVLPTDPEYTFSITVPGYQSVNGEPNVYPLPARTGIDPVTGNPTPVPAGNLQAEETLVVPVTIQRGYTAYNSPCHVLFQVPWSYQPNNNLNEFVDHTAVAADEVPGRTCTPQGIPTTYGGGGGGGGGSGVIGGGGPITIPVDVDIADAKVRLQITQSAVLTRNAFDGVLDVTNNSGAPLTNVHVNLTFTDTQGNDAAAAFFYQSPVLSGFSGSGDITATTGTGPSINGSDGNVNYLFIPTVSAAPKAPTVYNIGGSFSYDDAQGNLVTVPMFPATITVYPDAHFVLNYFWQRDVAGDNPFTPNVTEPSEPVYVGLIATNVGAGDAQNFTLTSSQPQIIDNQKGLLVSFTLTGTQVGANPISPTLTADLGDVPAGASQTVEWTMLSSLQGYFSNFSASYQHGDALGGVDTSLIDAVIPHELIHPTAGNAGKPDFLVAGDSSLPNSTLSVYYGLDDDGPTDPGTGQPTQVPVYSDQPNAVFDSNSGNAAPVNDIPASQVTTGPVTIDPATHILSVTVSATDSAGWNYFEIPDSAAPYPQYALASVTRSDGEVIGVGDNANAWQTDRVFDNYGFLNVHLLHLLDQSAGNQAYTYTLNYTPTAAVTRLTAVEALPAEIAVPQNAIKLFFSQPINPNSFNPANLQLQYSAGPNGPWTALSTTGLTISQFVGNHLQYTMSGLAALTSQVGYYQLTVNGSAVVDAGGNAVLGSETVAWQLSATALPTNILVGAGSAAYDQPITLTATVSPANPADGTPSGGTVQFAINGVAVGSPVAVVNGIARITVPGVDVGSYTVTAIYSGDGANFAGSSESSTISVGPAVVVLAIQPNSDWLLSGQELSVTATASTSGGTPLPPDGAVTFYDNGIPIASESLAVIAGQDHADLDTATLAQGRHVITVGYTSSSGRFAMTSPSAALTEVVFPSNATVLTVDNTSSDANVPGSLPWAIDQADASNAATVVDFASGNGQTFATPQTITLEAPLDVSDSNSIALEGPSSDVTLVGDYSQSRFPIMSVAQAANISDQGVNIGTQSPGANGDLAVAGVLDILQSVANLGSAVSVTSGGTINLGGQTVTADGLTLTNGSVIGGTLSIGNQTVLSSAVAADLTVSGGLVNEGGGRVVLSSANSYTGGTIVTGGTLEVSDSGALPDGSSLMVGAGAASLFGPSMAASKQAAAASMIVSANAAGTASADPVPASAPRTADFPGQLNGNIEKSAGHAYMVPARKLSSGASADAVLLRDFGPRPVDAVLAPHRAGAGQPGTGSAWFVAEANSWWSDDLGQKTDKAGTMYPWSALDAVLERFGV